MQISKQIYNIPFLDEFLISDKVKDPASDEPAYQTVTSNIEGNFANTASNANGHRYSYFDLTFEVVHTICPMN